MRFFSLLIILMIAFGGCCRRRESQLIGNFERNFETLGSIRDMFDEDRKLVRVAPAFTRLENDWSWPRPKEKLGFSEERWVQYRKLFETAGVKDGIQRDGAYVFFFVQSCGLGVSGVSRGYAYSKEAPSKLLKSLRDHDGKGIGFVRIRENWFLFEWAT